MDLIADIGGTNARCALVDSAGDTVVARSFANADFPSLTEVLAHFIANDCGEAPRRAALAIAAPLDGDEVAMTNIGWRFSIAALARSLKLTELKVLNDFEALAHALPLIGASECLRIGGGSARPGAAIGVIGPGSGLGVASLVRHGASWVAVPGEGGHVSVPVLTPLEAEIAREHAADNGHCAAETLLSGPGLVRIYRTLSRVEGNGGAGAQNEALTPAAVTERADQGDPIARRVFDVFFAMLGTVAGNLALTVGARGGIFIGGGIAPRLTSELAESQFRERFVGKGRYRPYLEAIPTAVITAEQPAFIGLKAVLAAI